MRRNAPLAAALAVLALALPLAGCLVGEQTVTVAADGSGTLRQSFVVDQKKADELFEMIKMLFGGGDMTAEQMPDPFAEVWWRKMAEGVPGYAIEKFADEAKDGKRTVTTESKFSSLATAAKAGAFFFSAVTLEQAAEADADKPAPPTWTLTFRDSLSAAKEAAGGSTNGMDVGALLAGFEPQLSGLSLKRVVVLPGKVVKTNGTLAEDGKSVSWTVDYKKIVEGKDLELSIVFEPAAGATLQAFTYRPNADALTRRFLEAAPKPPPAPPAGGETPPAPTK